MLKWLVAMGCIFSISNVYAEEGEWASNVELGYVQTGGNTQTKTIHSKLKSILDIDRFRTTLEGSVLNSSDQVKTTAEKYTASLQEDWKFSKKSYVLLRLAFDSDRFAGIKTRYVETVGYGRTLLNDDVWHGNMEIGVGSRQTQLIPSQRKNDVIARASTDWKWFMTEHTTLAQTLNTEGGKEGFLSHSVTSLQQQINETLSSKIAFSAEHTSKVPVGVKKLNTEMSVTLVLAY
ncbi:MAG: DUF481 domain-containing protein [Zetaproteobacteria bacterium]|nr:DUF481 domain-containing protein [Zetaproteobacteria bacterium]